MTEHSIAQPYTFVKWACVTATHSVRQLDIWAIGLDRWRVVCYTGSQLNREAGQLKETNPPMELPEIVTRVRGERSMRAFGDELGLTRAAVSLWESGTVRPSFDNALKLLPLVRDAETREALAREYGLRDVLQTLINELGVRAL